MNSKLSWPVDKKYPISFLFGEKPDWYLKIFGYPHNGLDIACPVGTIVKATDTGKVIFADSVPDQDGKGLILLHSWGTSIYWHLNRLFANYDENYPRGGTIGESGKTGYTTGPHLHFGIKVNGDIPAGMKGWTDPLQYLETGEPPETIPLPNPKTHLVLFGETLWGIAQKYYNNGTQWRRIYEANKEKISNPNLIRPFQRLIIP